MSEIQNPYGSPCSDAPADTTNDSTIGSPLKLTPNKSAESLSQPTSSSERITTLKRQIAELEEEKTCLTKSAADANQRANEAEKRAAAAEAETAAAKQRAQNRYTEKLHANNEVRHLREAIDKQHAQRRGHMIQVGNCFNGLKAKIIELECAKQDQDARHGEKIQSLESQLDAIRTSLSSSEEEKARLKMESDNIIKDLKKVIVGRQSSLDTADQVKASMKDEVAKLKDQIEEQEKQAKAKETGLIKINQELKKTESSWKLRFQQMQERANALEKQTEEARQQAQAIQLQGRLVEQQLYGTRKQLHATQQQLEASKQQAKLHLEGVKQQYLMAVRNMRQKAEFVIQQQPQQQLRPQQPRQPHPQLQPQPQENLLQQTFNPNKRRRLDSNGNATFDTNVFQPMHTQAFASSPTFTTQNTLGSSNGAITTAGTPNNMKGSLDMVPSDGYGQFPSLQSNVPTGPAAPSRQMQQPQYRSQLAMSPIQQCVFPPQLASPMTSQQSPYLQGSSMNDVGSVPQDNLPKSQDPPLNFDFDPSQQYVPDITIDTLLAMDMSEINDVDTMFLSNPRGNDALSGFADGVTANSNVMADSDTMAPQDEDLFNDLFNDDTLALFGDLSEVPSQDQAPTAVPTPDTTTNAGQVKRKRHFGQQ